MVPMQVENSVKGALALLGLALLQSVLSLVLTVGTLVLAVYAAHQVFGVRLPFLPPGGAASGAGSGSSQEGTPYSTGPQVDPRFGHGAYGPYGRQPPPGYGYGPGAGPTAPGYRPPQPGYGDWGQPYGPRPGDAGQRGQPRPGAGRQAGPTIDVYYDS
ncbi:hypothetical protein GPECTOR_94g645 [Gonium pectorale]|uniref:Uncharacterized protein n=1 Tax=Gonium pectorale TaxID=33097 RepID=A0A150G0B5_GONPE|nr:hypothetical protein GPECTOR_94g645 [Gonium pectorale]|eukprot:KXZ43323.1 hypothetical protein GPECTOR_94g645 [Gonium pectorale]